jgi:hypothetical protein
VYDDYLRRTVSGARNLMPPIFRMEPLLHSAPLSPRTPGDWDDLMISQLIAAGKRVTVPSEQDQWALFDKMYDKALAVARSTGRSQAPKECVTYLVLDNVKATMRLIEATTVTMRDNEASAPINFSTTSAGVRFAFWPGGDRGHRVIGTIHTHAFLDFLIDTSSTATGTRIGSQAVRGLSDIDTNSARTEGLVKYAIDAQYLHRADPDGHACQNRRRKQKGNVLRQALRVFGGEPRLRAEECGK